jgi:hypothetical protein
MLEAEWSGRSAGLGLPGKAKHLHLLHRDHASGKELAFTWSSLSRISMTTGISRDVWRILAMCKPFARP